MTKQLFKLTATAACMLILLSAIGAAAQNSGEDLEGRIHFIIAIEGEGTIRRASWDDPLASEPLILGDIVGQRDIISVSSGSSVVILCADGTIQSIGVVSTDTRERESVDCGVETSFDPESLLPLRSANPFREVIFTPTGRIASGRPEFDWEPTEGAFSYQIDIQKNSATVLRISNILEDRATYPNELPTLAPGTYDIIVYAYDIDLLAINQIEAVFEIVDDNVLASIENNVETYDLQLAVPRVREYLLAIEYADQGLIFDAVLTMESMLGVDFRNEGYAARSELSATSRLQDSPRPYLYLGYWYYMLQYNHESRQAYRAAVGLAQAADNGESMALAYDALGLVSNENPSEIYCTYGNALLYYNRISDMSNVQRIQEQMDSITTNLGFEPSCP